MKNGNSIGQEERNKEMKGCVGGVNKKREPASDRGMSGRQDEGRK